MFVSKTVRAVLHWIASVAEVAVAIALLYYLFHDLYKVHPPHINIDINLPGTAAPPPPPPASGDTCYLSTDGSNSKPCNFALVTIAITWAACLALSIIQCFTCNCCGLGFIFDTILAGCLCALWVVFSIMVTKNDHSIDGKNPSPVWNSSNVSHARNIYVGLSWAEVVLFGFSALLGITGILSIGEGRGSYTPGP